MMNLPKSVRICEVGLRDGLQNEKQVLTTEQKVELLSDLVDAGFKVIEVGSFMHPVKVPQMANTDDVYRAIAGKYPDVDLRALIPNLRGVTRAADCGCKKVKLNVSASREHNLRNLNRTPEESVMTFAECAALAKDGGIGLSGSISMPFASPWEGETPVRTVDGIIEAYLSIGVTEISLSDTSGMAVPAQVGKLCRHVRKKYPDATWWMHFHNTRGLAAANVIAAMDAGMTRFDSSFGGLGGCPFVPNAAGNLATEDVVQMCDESGIETGVRLDEVMEISQTVAEWLGHPMESLVLRAGSNRALMEKIRAKA